MTTRDEETLEEAEMMADDYICVDPARGEDLIDRYIAQTLSAAEAQAFEIHRHFCLKCQEDLEYMQWVLRELQTGQAVPEMPPLGIPLTVTSVCDPKKNLTPFFHDAPLHRELAADGEGQAMVQDFPLTVAYADGLVTGTFSNALGILWFKPQTLAIDLTRYACLLAYAPEAGDAQETRCVRKSWELSAAREVWLGDLYEFVPSLSPTPQQVMTLLRDFQVLLQSKP